jgi:Ca-activated chloride channel family protein
LVLLARLPEAGGAAPTGGSLDSVVVSGRIGGAPWRQTVAFTPAAGDAGVAKLWARERIAAYTRDLRAGGNRDDLAAAITALALRHHLVSDFTSLVAVDDVQVRPPGPAGHVEQAPTPAPAGSYWATTGFARTATPAPLLMLWGFMLMAAGVAAHGLLRRRSAP